MTIKVKHDVRVEDGGIVYLPPWKSGQEGYANLERPDVYVADTVQKYPLGTKFVDGDRVFHYGYVHTEESALATKGGYALCNIAVCKSTTTDAVVEPIGETEIQIEDTDSTVNQWAGGYFMPMANPTITYRVLSNTVSDGEHSVLTLERGLIAATTASLADCRLNQNPYSKLCGTWASGRAYVSWMGVTLIPATASTWQWVQTWGPVNMAGGDERPGSENYLRMGQIHMDGTLVNYAWDTTTAQQIAGYVINSTGADTTASWFIYLMIAC